MFTANRLLLATFLFIVSSFDSKAWRIEDNCIVIENGDTLWEISHELYSRGFDYNKIWEARVDTIANSNPSLIYDGMRIDLDRLPPLGLKTASCQNYDSLFYRLSDCLCDKDTIIIKDGGGILGGGGDEPSLVNALFVTYKLVIIPLISYLLLWFLKRKFPESKRFVERSVLIILVGSALVILAYNINIDISSKIDNSLNLTAVLITIISIVGLLTVIYMSYSFGDRRRSDELERRGWLDNKYHRELAYEEISNLILKSHDEDRRENSNLKLSVRDWLYKKGIIYLSEKTIHQVEHLILDFRPGFIRPGRYERFLWRLFPSKREKYYQNSENWFLEVLKSIKHDLFK